MRIIRPLHRSPAAALAMAAAAWSTAHAAGFVDVAGARIVSQVSLTPRTVALTIASPSFSANTVVEVTLPTGYAGDPARRWPVTYYLAGTSHDQTTFRADYDGEALTASYPSIVVSPNGASGYWSDWFDFGAGGPPLYETFVSAQLIPLIDANFRTIADRAHRAVMGESMGGDGAAMMAARHPDLFVAAASLSGAVDTNWPLGAAILAVSPALMLAPPDAIYGPRITEEARWRGHDPVDLAGNLRGVALQLRTGSGALGLVNGETPADLPGCALESAVIQPESASLHATLATLAIAHTWQQYGWGCHTAALFEQEIADTLPGLAGAFGAAPPASFDYRSVESSFTVFGWSITADPARALEFLALQDVGRHGLALSGSGTTTVTTPPMFAPSRWVRVLVDGVTTGVMASPAGRITFTVGLGPADAQQQYRIGTTTTVTTAHVAFDQD